jgi:hypothetical protein
VAVVGLEFGVVVFQVQYLGDTGEVDSLPDEIADPLQAIQVVIAVPTCAALGTSRVSNPRRS